MIEFILIIAPLWITTEDLEAFQRRVKENPVLDRNDHDTIIEIVRSENSMQWDIKSNRWNQQILRLIQQLLKEDGLYDL